MYCAFEAGRGDGSKTFGLIRDMSINVRHNIRPQHFSPGLGQAVQGKDGIGRAGGGAFDGPATGALLTVFFVKAVGSSAIGNNDLNISQAEHLV